ncbi:cytochrome P450 6k1-like [Ceratina calcarata]|uniref:Cytochrome P450 6k1-like n=1 Tax=Ceratina calcarata TaxID=156304 RepID=A0AAJ7J7F9_9HYME|nr:cytochrome P450 6k1-like [Ceratina calcarata]
MALLVSFFVDLLIALITLGVLLALYMKQCHTYWQRRGVPTLPGHWLFGNIKDVVMQKNSAGMVIGELHNQASEDDDVLGIYILHKPYLLIRSPELIKQILVKDFNNFPDRFFTARSFRDKIGSSNLFTIQNPEWRYLRTKITPVFTSGKMKRVCELIAETSDCMSKYLEAEFSHGTKTKVLPMKEIAMKYTTDIISSVAFGIKVNSFDSDKTKFYDQAQEGVRLTLYRSIRLTIMFFFPKIAPYLGGQFLGSSTNYFRQVFWDSFHSREKSNIKRGDLIDSLIDLKSGEQEKQLKFEGDVLVSQAAIFFVAGRESSVTTISMSLYELAKNPTIQKRAREEIREKLAQHGMTYEGIQSMKYLQQIMSETLRLYPPAPLLDRVAVNDYKIPGTDIVIEKGTPIYVALCGIHRDPRYFPDPLRYDPDRFSDENKDNIKACTYMPFGEGPRICIGARLGTLQSAMGIIPVLKDYEVSLDPTYKGRYVDGRNIFIVPEEGFRLKLTKL